MLPKLMEKYAMKDPTTAHCRIYIGNLPDQAQEEDLYDMFVKHGVILGILLNKGFGFIQYQEESSALDAIKEQHGCTYLAKSLIVRTAVANPDKVKQGSELNKKSDTSTSADNSKTSTQDRSNNESDSYDKDSGNDGNWKDESGRGFNNNRSWTNRGSRGGQNRHQRDGGSNFRERSPMGRDWRNYERYPTETFAPDRNDCEIIVVSKALTEYAEYIEDRLKRHGITVDLLFPKEDVPIGRVLGNIHSRGCLYAILIMPQNEEFRSLTLNILHGLPQEHRHMPIEDALTLISRNFAEYRSGVATAGSREAMLALLGQLADGRSLTVLQYDRVIEYLKEKRETQVKVELGNAADPPKEVVQNDLQQMILSMLNNDTPARPAPPQSKSTEGVSDPTIQKALDSFLQKLV